MKLSAEEAVVIKLLDANHYSGTVMQVLAILGALIFIETRFGCWRMCIFDMSATESLIQWPVVFII